MDMIGRNDCSVRTSICVWKVSPGYSECHKIVISVLLLPEMVSETKTRSVMLCDGWQSDEHSANILYVCNHIFSAETQFQRGTWRWEQFYSIFRDSKDSETPTASNVLDGVHSYRVGQRAIIPQFSESSGSCGHCFLGYTVSYEKLEIVRVYLVIACRSESISVLSCVGSWFTDSCKHHWMMTSLWPCDVASFDLVTQLFSLVLRTILYLAMSLLSYIIIRAVSHFPVFLLYERQSVNNI